MSFRPLGAPPLPRRNPDLSTLSTRATTPLRPRAAKLRAGRDPAGARPPPRNRNRTAARRARVGAPPPPLASSPWILGRSGRIPPVAKRLSWIRDVSELAGPRPKDGSATPSGAAGSGGFPPALPRPSPADQRSRSAARASPHLLGASRTPSDTGTPFLRGAHLVARATIASRLVRRALVLAGDPACLEHSSRLPPLRRAPPLSARDRPRDPRR